MASNIPVIGQIRTFQDVQRALESIRSWFAAAQLSISGNNSSVSITQSASASQFPNPITDEYISSAARWNTEVSAVTPLECIAGSKILSLNYDAAAFEINNLAELSVSSGIFDRIISHDDNAIFHEGDIVYV